MAKTILEHTVLVEQEEIPIVWRGDIIVAGDGPTGLGAAIAARRKGAKVMLLEQHGFLGGMCSYGTGVPLRGAYLGLRTIGGIAEEIPTKVRDAGPDAADVRHVPLFGGWYFHDSEYSKSMMAEMVMEKKLEMRFHTFVSDVIMDGDRRVIGIITGSKSGRQAYLVEAVADASGDADLCARAGAGFEKGDEKGAMMGVAIMFNMGGVDVKAYQNYIQEDPGSKKAKEQAEKNGHPVSEDDKYSSIHVGMRPGSLFMNSMRVRGIGGISIEDLTRAELEGRVRIMEEVNFFRRYAPGYENCYIMNSGAQVGIWDTRRIVGEDHLSKEDCLGLRKRPEDVILRCTGPFDNTARGNEKTYILNQTDIEEWYNIPYGCVVPIGLDNIAVAGWTFSCHHLALTSSRGQALLMGLGQVVGIAAVMAVWEKTAFRDVEVRELQRTLIADNCDLGTET